MVRLALVVLVLWVRWRSPLSVEECCTVVDMLVPVVMMVKVTLLIAVVLTGSGLPLLPLCYGVWTALGRLLRSQEV